MLLRPRLEYLASSAKMSASKSRIHRLRIWDLQTAYEGGKCRSDVEFHGNDFRLTESHGKGESGLTGFLVTYRSCPSPSAPSP